MRAEDWERLARDHLAAAKLLAQPFPALAYYHAGYAVEFALKLRIMRRERLAWWPARAARPELHTHHLPTLGRLAWRVAWSEAQNWSAEVRYDPRAFPQRRTADMLDAVDGSGFLLWLLR